MSNGHRAREERNSARDNGREMYGRLWCGRDGWVDGWSVSELGGGSGLGRGLNVNRGGNDGLDPHLVVERVELFGRLARNSGRGSASSGPLIESRAERTHERVLFHGPLSIGHLDCVANVENSAVVVYVGVIAEMAAGTVEVEVEPPVEQIVGRSRQTE